MFDVTIVSVAITLLVEMLLFTITKLDVIMFEQTIAFTLMLHVDTLDEVKLDVEMFDTLI
jgi:hypothetical protein